MLKKYIIVLIIIIIHFYCSIIKFIFIKSYEKIKKICFKTKLIIILIKI